jgi:hypothetical protein
VDVEDESNQIELEYFHLAIHTLPLISLYIYIKSSSPSPVTIYVVLGNVYIKCITILMLESESIKF